ncbi:MAG: hypothetical protein IJU23_10570 [Proteobacteria bacterium]|nr:hypothetical protein [Pseudomonadota bacterium]
MHKFLNTVAFCACTLLGVCASAQEIEGGDSTATDTQVAAEPVADAGASGEAAVADGAVDATAGEDGTLAEDGGIVEPEPVPVVDEKAEKARKDAELVQQLHDVSANLDTLKEDTFATKSRLLLLREEILQRAVTGSHLLIHHKDDFGGQYELTQIHYAIDRTTIFTKQDSNGIKLDEEEIIYDEIIASGAHQLSVLYVFKGKKWGIFTYMTDYTFRVESGYDFVIDDGNAAELTIVASEDGDIFTAYEDRPTVKYEYQQGEYDLLKNYKSAGDADDVTTANTKSDK